MSTLLDRLNEEQRQVALDHMGKMAVLAGPGAGKTATLVARTVSMIESGIPSSKILLFTFTKKAANEIKERIRNQIGGETEYLTIGTYHSVCCRILRKYAHHLGYNKNFSIYDDDDRNSLLKDICGIEIDHKVLASKIADYKKRFLSPDQAIALAETKQERNYAELYKIYQSSMMSQNSLDFDDLVFKTVILLDRFPDVKSEINAKWHYIISDESQDASLTDKKLINHLGGELKNICLFLDNDQAIMGFRGADMSGIMQMIRKDNYKTYFLSINYRSTQVIVDASRKVIANNEVLIKKQIRSNNEKGNKIIHFSAQNTSIEALRTAQIIERLAQSKKYEYKDIAILVRMSYLTRALEEEFLKHNIPYKIVNNSSFFQRKEIKDVLSYLIFLQNPLNIRALKRIINVPKSGIGEKKLSTILEVFTDDYKCDNINLTKVLEDLTNLANKGVAKKGLQDFVALIRSVYNFSLEHSVPETIEELIRLLNYKQYILATERENAEEKVANVEELINISHYYSSIEEMIQSISLTHDIENEEKNNDDEDNCVKIMTMHSSKGLEFKVVFLNAVMDGICPHWKAYTDVQQLEEERRLFYVAMTRAKNLLVMTYPLQVIRNGQMISTRPSRFISEIPEEYLQTIR